ncbi:protein GLUTAMINE DUMPER 2 [Canna indica]|uniref:Protein GLUTAMINE DUMPER 2 n=1 Tax=Canna indica TaxID=4628 RepID=A0AAQ3JS63_9LILI|nr:protein GLUTAMINE DUMPER 2 [Canna indica]
MRTGAGFDVNGVSTMASASAPSSSSPHSAWHSPIPYLFGGLAAMLGLIAFALLILACSYWKVSSYLESGDDAAGPSHDDPEKPSDASAAKSPAWPEDRFLVIMPGDCAPTVLAVPIAIRSAPADKSPEQDDTRRPESHAN